MKYVLLPLCLACVASSASAQSSVQLFGTVDVGVAYLTGTGQRERRDISRAMTSLNHILRDELMAALLAHLPAGYLLDVAAAVAGRAVDPYSAAEEILAAFLDRSSGGEIPESSPTIGRYLQYSSKDGRKWDEGS